MASTNEHISIMANRIVREFDPVPKDLIVSTPDVLERVRDWVGSVLRYAQQEGVVLYDSGRSKL